MTKRDEDTSGNGPRTVAASLMLVAALSSAGCAGTDLERQSTRLMRRTIPPGVSEPI